MLKSSIKGVDGQSMVAIVGGGLYLLYQVLSGDNSTIPIDVILEKAQSAKEIVDAYKINGSASMITEGWSTVKLGGILTFIYKFYGRFIDSRTKLKEKELETSK